MPCENEVKYVLRRSLDLKFTLMAKYGWHDIIQGYLNPNNRIREITSQSGLITYVFSYKQRLSNNRNVEIESDIPKQDYDDLWKDTTHRLNKRRVSKFVQLDAESIRWDIDFPNWNCEIPFDMAEVEMPTHLDRPSFILEDIAPFVVYEVPRTDGRFSAKKLSCEKHAMKMAKELRLL